MLRRTCRFAHFKTSPAARDAAVAERRCVEVYRGIADLLHPAAIPVVLRCGGVTVPAYFRCAAAGAPIVILLNGLDSCKEVELHRFGDLFLARGLNVLAVDAPARGRVMAPRRCFPHSTPPSLRCSIWLGGGTRQRWVSA